MMKRPKKAQVFDIKTGNILKGNISDYEPETIKMRALVNGLVRDYMRRGGKLNQLALKANLSIHTVSRLAYYETTRPQWETIIRICRALDCMKELARIFDDGK